MTDYRQERTYQRVLTEIDSNKAKRLAGQHVVIPWPSLPRFSTVIPGIEKKRYNLVSAPPKVGKTQITDFLFMFEPVRWIMANPNSNIKLKIFYFSLEMSKEAKIRSAIAHRLFRDYGIGLSPQKMLSTFKSYILDDKVHDIMRSDEFLKWLEEFESIVEIHDDVRNPFGIYNVVKTFAEANGHYTYKYIKWTEEDGRVVDKKVIDTYVPNNPDLFVIIITDHVGLLQTENNKNLHATISKYSSKYCLKMRDRWGFIPVNVQQQSAESSNADWANSGKIIIDKMKPTPEGLADMKYTSRDVDMMLSLFDPSKYGIIDYRGWDLAQMDGSHRELAINLNRNGVSNTVSQLYFNGASSFFVELPTNPSREVYNDVAAWKKITI